MTGTQSTHRPEVEPRSERQLWMAVLARARTDELEMIVARHGGLPSHAVLKPADVGTVMVEARAGGTGVRFNAGEATMTRCVVRLSGGTLGFSYGLGSDKRKALLAALLDALLQDRGDDVRVLEDVRVLAEKQAAARDLASRKAAATKVEFFTLVRGSDR